MRLFFCVVFLIPTKYFCQSYPVGAKHTKTIYTTIFDNNDTVEHNIVLTYYDSLWQEVISENTLKSALNKGSYSVTLTQTPQKFVSASISPNGDTSNTTVYLYNEQGKQVYHYEIKGLDTTISQKRKYDSNGNNTELYNKKNGVYFLFMEFEYDQNNEISSKKMYNNAGGLVKFEKYERKRNGEIIDHYEYLNGFGCTLKYVKGGYSITENSNNNNLVRLEIYDQSNNLTTSVFVEYTDIE